jgi:hypothetical protein
MESLLENWEQLVPIVIAVAAVINGHTPTWKKWPTLIGKLAGLVLKVCALWTEDRQGAMKKRVIAARNGVTAGLILLLFGCAGWQDAGRRTLDHVHESGVVAREIGLPIYDQLCKKKAIACRAVNDKVCEPLVKCHEEMDKFKLSLKSIQFLFIDGKYAIDVASQDSAKEVISKAMVLLLDIRKQLAELGVTL